MKYREQQIEEVTRRLIEGGWSSIYNFVEKHIDDWELEDDEEDEDLNNEN